MGALLHVAQQERIAGALAGVATPPLGHGIGKQLGALWYLLNAPWRRRDRDPRMIFVTAAARANPADTTHSSGGTPSSPHGDTGARRGVRGTAIIPPHRLYYEILG